jgi:hypothetical protein
LGKVAIVYVTINENPLLLGVILTEQGQFVEMISGTMTLMGIRLATIVCGVLLGYPECGEAFERFIGSLR